MTSHSTPKKLVVLGQGYVGLPLALRAYEQKIFVVGFEIDAIRVADLQQGLSPVHDITNAYLQNAVASGRYIPTNDPAYLTDFDIAILCVPTPLRGTVPDLGYIEHAIEILAPYVTKGCTIVLESTTYPGTTQELLAPRLESLTGFRPGIDFYLGYSPERIDPGNDNWDLVNTPKIISGVNEISTKHVEEFYQILVSTTIRVSSPIEAELVKLLENTFRHINIALVNELAIFSHELGIDIWEAIRAAGTKPFGFLPFTPGPGVGGHCLPIDPSYLSWKVERSLGQQFRFVNLANEINASMPKYVAQRIEALLTKYGKSVSGSHILLLGLSYKRNTGDIRESPSIHLANLLLETGAVLSSCDPFVQPREVPKNIVLRTLSKELLDACDLIVLLVDHEVFLPDEIMQTTTPILDTKFHLRRNPTISQTNDLSSPANGYIEYL